MSDGIIVNIKEESFNFLSHLIEKEYDFRVNHNSFILPYPPTAYENGNFFNNAVNDFVEKLKKYSEEMILLKYLKEVFNMPMVNMRLSDDEVNILDFAVFRGNSNSRKNFVMELAKNYVKSCLKVPADFNLSDKELLVFIESERIREYENLRSFVGEEQFKLIIEKSELFTDINDYEDKKSKIFFNEGSEI